MTENRYLKEENNKKSNSSSWAWLLVAILGILLVRTCNKASEAVANAKMYESANDTLTRRYNERGEEITTTKLIMATNADEFKHNLHIKDSTIKKLQELVDKHTITATVLNTTTHEHGTTGTTITKTETVLKHDTVFVYPTYSSTWSERWSNGTITASKDSISRNISMLNEYDIKQSYERNGTGLGKYFKQRVPTVEVTNKNPFTTTTALKSYTLAPDKKTKRRAFIVGIIMGAGAMIGMNYLNK